MKGRNEAILTERNKWWKKYLEDILQIQTFQSLSFWITQNIDFPTILEQSYQTNELAIPQHYP